MRIFFFGKIFSAAEKFEPIHIGCYEVLKDSHIELGLRAAHLAYVDQFTRRRVEIRAPTEEFLREYGFIIA